MSTILNDRDVLLQATSPRSLGTAVPGLIVDSDSNVFKVVGGVGSPTVINLSAKLVNMAGTVSWSVLGATGVTPSGNAATLAYSAMTANAATVTAQITYNGTLYQATRIISKVTDGTNGSPGSNGSNGTRGTVQIVGNGYSSWSDSSANSEIISATGTGPINRDIVTLTNGSFTQSKFYQSGSWLTLSAYVDGNLLVSGTLAAGKIAGGTLSGVSIDIGSGAFTVNSLGILHLNGLMQASLGGQFFQGATYPAVSGTSTSGQPAISGVNNSSGDALSLTATSGYALRITSGGNGIVQTGGGVNYFNSLNPNVDGGASLGASGSFRWSAVYANSSTITTSDARSKMEIVDSDLGLAFINSLRAVRYLQRVAENIVTETSVAPTEENANPDPIRTIMPRAGVRPHYGFLAGEVRAALIAAGVADAALWVLSDPTDPDSEQALRYEELIAPLIRAVQELSARVAALESR